MKLAAWIHVSAIVAAIPGAWLLSDSKIPSVVWAFRGYLRIAKSCKLLWRIGLRHDD
jgi:hypothetical protein